MTVTPMTVYLPDALWRAVQACAVHDGDANTVIIRALEEYLGSLHRKRGRRLAGKYKKLVASLSRPVVDLHLSARPAACLRLLGIRYVYELVPETPAELRTMRNFGEKSLREVQGKLAALGLSLGMTLDDESYRAAVVATVAANIQATEG